MEILHTRSHRDDHCWCYMLARNTLQTNSAHVCVLFKKRVNGWTLRRERLIWRHVVLVVNITRSVTHLWLFTDQSVRASWRPSAVLSCPIASPIRSCRQHPKTDAQNRSLWLLKRNMAWGAVTRLPSHLINSHMSHWVLTMGSFNITGFLSVTSYSAVYSYPPIDSPDCTSSDDHSF
jgi:hypothetical protein